MKRRLPQEDPIRYKGETAIYEDDPFELGESGKNLKVVEDFLPPPEEMKKARIRILHKDDKTIETREPVVIHLKQDNLEFYQNQAKERNISSTELIEEVLSAYAQSKR